MFGFIQEFFANIINSLCEPFDIYDSEEENE